MLKYIKLKWKQIFCDHRYMQDSRVYATHTQTGDEVTLNIVYKCVNCGKEIRIIFDEEHQINY